MRTLSLLSIALVAGAARPALADDEPAGAEPAGAEPAEPALPTEPEPEPDVDDAPPVSAISVHGFISEGGFVSTANNFLGTSARGSLEFFEAAINATADHGKLRGGVQLFSQSAGTLNDATPRLDWAFLDYQSRPWLGVRAGRVRIPFGLYNDYIDIDAARLPILLPQSVYPYSTRAVLTAQTGLALYGTTALGGLGELDYQLYGGALSLPYSGAGSARARVYRNDSKYVVGGQAFWRPPVEGLRVGGTLLRASLDQHALLSASFREMLIASGAAPPDFDGTVVVTIDPANLWIASVEYARDAWSFAAEYSRWYIRTRLAPAVIPLPAEAHTERAYAMASYQATERLALGAYVSVLHANVNDRGGDMLPEPYLGWSRDASLAVRYDINDHWLFKLEAHVIDGTAGLDQATNPTTPALPERFWGLFLFRTTLSF